MKNRHKRANTILRPYSGPSGEVVDEAIAEAIDSLPLDELIRADVLVPKGEFLRAEDGEKRPVYTINPKLTSEQIEQRIAELAPLREIN